MNRYLLSTFFLIFLTLSVSVINSSGYGIPGSYEDFLTRDDANYSRFEGDFLFVEAFRTDCSHCIDQHPDLQKLYDNYTDEIKMLSLAGSADDWDKIENFVENHETEWFVGLDNSNGFQRTFGVSGTPTMILFNGNGDVLESWVGRTPYSEIAAEIDARLSGAKTDIFEGDLTEVGRIPGSQSSIIGDIFGNLGFQVIFLSIGLIMIYSKISSPAPAVAKEVEVKSSKKKTPEEMFAEYEQKKKSKKSNK